MTSDFPSYAQDAISTYFTSESKYKQSSYPRSIRDRTVRIPKSNSYGEIICRSHPITLLSSHVARLQAPFFYPKNIEEIMSNIVTSFEVDLDSLRCRV